jgi:hypothetical protein
MSDNIKFVQNQSTTLAGAGAPIGATSIILTSLTTIDGVALTMTDFGIKGYATIEPGNGVQEESIVFTGITQNIDGTATLTGVSNKLTITPYTETSGLFKSHAGGTTFIISNTAGMYDDMTGKNNDETVTGKWTFTQTPTISVAPVANTDAANKGYVDGVAIAGAPKATETVYGITKLSSAMVNPLAPIVLNIEEVAATSAANKVVRANGSGYIDKGFIELGATNPGLDFATNGIEAKVDGTTILKGASGLAANVGTALNQIVQLDGSAKLPAVDGSQLTGISNFLFQGVGSATSNKSYYNYSIPFMTTSGGNPTTAAMWSVGGGQATMQFYFCTFAAGGAGQTLSAIKTGAGTAINFGTKKIITEFSASLSGVGTNMVCWGIGETFTNAYNSAANKACFFVIDTAGNLYAKTSNGGGGSDHTETPIAGVTLTVENTYRIEYNPGVSALFYINGVLKATIVTTLPNASQAFIGFGTAISGTNYINAISAPRIAVEK